MILSVHCEHAKQEQEINGRKTTVVDASAFRVGMRVDLLRGVPQP